MGRNRREYLPAYLPLATYGGFVCWVCLRACTRAWWLCTVVRIGLAVLGFKARREGKQRVLVSIDGQSKERMGSTMDYTGKTRSRCYRELGTHI